jgi:hypothetical protein
VTVAIREITEPETLMVVAEAVIMTEVAGVGVVAVEEVVLDQNPPK